MTLAVIGILYGAMLAFAQTDLKRLVAYTSVSHMGFVLLGIFAWNSSRCRARSSRSSATASAPGRCSSSSAPCRSASAHARLAAAWADCGRTMPRLGGVAMFFALASLGLPGLGNFVGEFLVLLGTYQRSVTLAVCAALGLIVATVYSLWIVQQAFHGPNREGWKLPDLGRREAIMMGILMAALLWLGLYPAPLFRTTEPARRP